MDPYKIRRRQWVEDHTSHTDPDHILIGKIGGFTTGIPVAILEWTMSHDWVRTTSTFFGVGIIGVVAAPLIAPYVKYLKAWRKAPHEMAESDHVELIRIAAILSVGDNPTSMLPPPPVVPPHIQHFEEFTKLRQYLLQIETAGGTRAKRETNTSRWFQWLLDTLKKYEPSYVVELLQLVNGEPTINGSRVNANDPLIKLTHGRTILERCLSEFADPPTGNA